MMTPKARAAREWAIRCSLASGHGHLPSSFSVIELLLAKGYEPTGLGPDEFMALIRRQFVSGGNLVKVSGAQVE